jgi:hypothetical protein
MSYRIFISVRFEEAFNEAQALKTALEARGISTFLCAVHPGGDIALEIVNALRNCQLAIIMGTKTYGKDTGIGYSTFEELRYIHEQRKPFFLVKMCNRFEVEETIFRMGNSVSYFLWLPVCPMPGDLVPKILEKLESTSVGSESNDNLVSPLPSSAMIRLESLKKTRDVFIFDYDFPVSWALPTSAGVRPSEGMKIYLESHGLTTWVANCEDEYHRQQILTEGELRDRCLHSKVSIIYLDINNTSHTVPYIYKVSADPVIQSVIQLIITSRRFIIVLKPKDLQPYLTQSQLPPEIQHCRCFFDYGSEQNISLVPEQYIGVANKKSPNPVVKAFHVIDQLLREPQHLLDT